MFLALCLAALTVVTLDVRERQGGPLEALQRGALAAFAPVQRTVSTGLRPVGDLLASVGQLGSLRTRNRALEAEVTRLQAANRAVTGVTAENNALRGLLGMAKRCGCTTVGAHVVARAGSTFSWSVTIDAGAREGIRPDQPVVDADGLVGRVIRVSADYATVLLLNDPSSGVAVNAAGTRAPGLVRGRGRDRLQLELLQPDSEVSVGDMVVTRGYQGGIFPPGLPVGVVDAVGPAGPDLVRSVGVRPFSDSGSLAVVEVIVAVPAAPARAGAR